MTGDQLWYKRYHTCQARELVPTTPSTAGPVNSTSYPPSVLLSRFCRIQILAQQGPASSISAPEPSSK